MSAASLTRPGPEVTLGARLERDRLRHRAARLEGVVEVLRERARGYVPGGVPPALLLSLADFERELGTVRARLGRA